MNAVLDNKAINGWSLFWIVSLAMSAVIVVNMLAIDMSSPEGVSHMIGYSVRWAVPFIFLVVAISASRKLFPGTATNWLLRNRKYIGLIFAVAMAWQGLFIFLMSNFHRDYYFEEIFYLRDELEGSTGYLFLAAMVVTSFRFGRKYLTPKQWRMLHLSGLYFLWAYPFSVYFWNLFYYENPQLIDYIFYWSGFTAFALRILAWGKKRQSYTEKVVPGGTSARLLKGLGGALLILGLTTAATGLSWLNPVSEYLLTPAWSENLYYWLPYWPFEPFFSLAILGLGVYVFTYRSPVVASRASAAT